MVKLQDCENFQTLSQTVVVQLLKNSKNIIIPAQSSSQHYQLLYNWFQAHVRSGVHRQTTHLLPRQHKNSEEIITRLKKISNTTIQNILMAMLYTDGFWIMQITSSQLPVAELCFLTTQIEAGQIGSTLYLTPGMTHSISKRRLAAVKAVLPLRSYGGDTCKRSNCHFQTASLFT